MHFCPLAKWEGGKRIGLAPVANGSAAKIDAITEGHAIGGKPLL
jgi:hypothetical protein